jgi:hypothetical protein
MSRCASACSGHAATTAFHAEVEAFHERVRQGFHAQAAADPDAWQVIDATLAGSRGPRASAGGDPRLYRLMTWPTLILGHDAVWARLAARLADERLPHALLFTGAPGIGKALLARRLAGRLACTAADDQRPCGDCNGCRQVLAGTHPDLLAIAAPDRSRKETRKKEIGIDQARELKTVRAAARRRRAAQDGDRR